MKSSMPMRAVAAALILVAGSATQVLADHRGPESGPKQDGRRRPSRSAEKCFSTCKPRLNRFSNEHKHLIRDAMHAAEDAMEMAAEADPPLTPEEQAMLLESSLASIEEAAAAARAELDASGEKLLAMMMEKGATEAQLERARKFLARLSEKLDERAERAAGELRERFDELFGPESDDDSDDSDCDDGDESPPTPSSDDPS